MNYSQHKILVDETIDNYLQESDADPRIVDGMRYVLKGGKRLRPILTLAILEKLSPETWNEYIKLCLVPEFIHCASLIIDDLPAFDDAKERRNQICVHIAKGEGIAYLLSFNLVTEAIILIQNHLGKLKRHYTEKDAYAKYETQLQYIIQNIGNKRALGGQLLSTYHTGGSVNVRDLEKPERLDHKLICDILYKKTSSFFEIAIVVGWIIGHGDLDKLDEIQRLSNLLGLCYQIYDDYIDYHEDTDDAAHFSHNYVYHRGIDQAATDFLVYKSELGVLINKLNLQCPVFDYIQNFMETSIMVEKQKLKNTINL